MRSLKFSVLDAFGDLRAGGLARPAAEKFAGLLFCRVVVSASTIESIEPEIKKGVD